VDGYEATRKLLDTEEVAPALAGRVLVRLSPGAHYLVTPDLGVGVRVGWGLNDQSVRFFANAGFGWRY
jgi:hypothetical protein